MQIGYASLLFALVLLWQFDRMSFIAGFAFSYLYVALFFYSIKLIFKKKKQAMGFFLMFIKWLLLLLALFLVTWALDSSSFLLGLSALLVLFLSYILKQLKFFERSL